MSSLEEWSIPVAFHFNVKVDGEEIPFSEVQGIECTQETKLIKQGGNNNECYHLPTYKRFSDLVLKRGYCKKDDSFFQWCQDILTFELSQNSITLKDIDIMLLNQNNEPLATWHFKYAYPTKWSIGNFDAMKNEIVLETVTLKYSSFFVDNNPYSESNDN